MNKIIHALLYLGLIVVSIISINSIHGRVKIPQFRSKFKNLIIKNDLAVVHFVNYDVLPHQEEQAAKPKQKTSLDDRTVPVAQEMMHKEDMDDEKMQEPSEADYMLDTLGDMKEAFRAAAKSTRYKRANVVFIGVDVTKIPRLMEEYDLREFSTLMLFKDGIPFEFKAKVVKTHALLTSRSKIKDFIDVHFDDFIADILEDIAEQERRRPRTRVTRVYSYPRRRYHSGYYGYGHGYPYRGYGYGGRYRRYGGYGYPYGGYGYGGRGYGGVGFGHYGRRGGFHIGIGW